MSHSNQDTSHRGTYVIANGLNIYYQEYGDGEPLVLLHGGLGTGALQWEPLIPFLAPHFRLIIPDARGHGRTEIPPGEIRIPVLADDAAAFITALGLVKPYLCGWSMGGDTTLLVGIRYPDLVGGLVVGGATHRVSEEYLDSIASLGVHGPGRVNPERIEKALPRLVDVHTQCPDHWHTLLTQLSYEIAEPSLPSHDDLRKIETPTLIFWGDRDQFLPIENAVELYRLVPNAELAVLPNADHFLFRSNPTLVANLIKEFLQRQAS